MLFHYDLIKMNHTNSISEDTVMLCTNCCCTQVNVTLNFIHKFTKTVQSLWRVKDPTSTDVELHCTMNYDLQMMVRVMKKKKKKARAYCYPLPSAKICQHVSVRGTLNRYHFSGMTKNHTGMTFNWWLATAYIRKIETEKTRPISGD